jgi:hypothetical protein
MTHPTIYVEDEQPDQGDLVIRVDLLAPVIAELSGGASGVFISSEVLRQRAVASGVFGCRVSKKAIAKAIKTYSGKWSGQRLRYKHTNKGRGWVTA